MARRWLALAVCALMLVAACTSESSDAEDDEASAQDTTEASDGPDSGNQSATTGTAPADNPATMGYDLEALTAAMAGQTEFCDAYLFANDTATALLTGAADAEQAEVTITFFSSANARLIAIAPAELSAPLQIVADAYVEITALASQANFDPAVVFGPGFGEELATPDVVSAQNEVDTYFLGACTGPGPDGPDSQGGGG